MTAAILPPTHPVLLLPIRIETALDGTTLFVRVYPDEIHLDRRPTLDGGKPTARPRLLPDRFVATGWRDGDRAFAVTGTPISEDALRVSLDLGADAPDAGMSWLWDFATAEQAGMALRVTLDPPRLDRLLVFGIRDGLDATATETALAELLAARDDVRFVTPGDPTNQVAPVPPPTTGSAAPAPATTGSPPAATDTPGTRLGTALGLPAGTLEGVAEAGTGEDGTAAAMHAALWPATWGYYLAHRLAGPNGPTIGAADLERARRAFIDDVRSDGPLPTLRFGDQPYGFLPVTALDAWVGTGEALGAGAVDVVRRARAVWLAAAAGLPRAGDGPDGLLEVLRNTETTTAISARTLMGPLYAANLLHYLGMPEWAGWLAERDQLGTAELRAAGLGWTPPAARSVFAPAAFPIRAPFVAKTTPAFLTWLSNVDLTAPPVLGPAPAPPPPSTSLLDVVARHALGRAYANAAGQAAPEGELLGFGLPGQVPLTLTQASSPELAELRTALIALGAQSTDALARHFTGTLDLAAHRLDAWITAVATERLATMRTDTPHGLRVGAFGWVEGLVPRSADATAGGGEENAGSEGWIAAPSLAHATTAAVLRNGYRARRLNGEASGMLAVDLSSRRVRRALRLLEEVRAGRTLATVLGGQLERGLHDAHLDPLIERFRGFLPVPGGGTTDGLAVAQQWVDQSDLPGFDLGADLPAVTPILDALTDTVDAIADLTLAEGVHQLVGGNPVRTGALFDALGRGEQPPPELAVTTTPRRAVHHTVRLLVALPANAARATGAGADWPAARDSIRAAAEPRSDAWAAGFLGPASDAAFTVVWTDTAGHSTEVPGTLADTDLAPLDLVALSDRPAALDGWLIRATAQSAPPGGTASVTARPDAALELAATLRRVLAAARTAIPTDLDPDAAQVETEPPYDPDAEARATAAARALDAAIAAGLAELAALADSIASAGGTGAAGGTTATAAAPGLADALVALARFGIPESLPVDGEAITAASDRLTRAVDVARRRAAAAAAASGVGAVLSALLDDPFVVFGALPLSALPQRSAPDPAATIGWLDRIGRVRAGAGALSDLLLYDEGLGRGPAFALAQLPHDPAEPTLIADAAGLPDPRQLTLIHLPDGRPLPTQAAAVLIDGWVEPVPKAQETAGLAFHVPRPASQPPQACLIAVPPDRDAPWSTASLEAVLLETLDAVRMRAVPAEALTGGVQLLPALQFAFNPAGETISTSFAGLAAE
jgi:hypothetical protein